MVKTAKKIKEVQPAGGNALTLEAFHALIAQVKEAQNIYATYSQEKVDAIFKAAATAADKARIDLAEMAIAETGMGVLEDKIIKNHFAAEYIYHKHKNAKTCGVIAWDKVNGIKTVAAPLGIIAGIVPTTNPTSTAIFKSLLALKTRNAIIFSPHPRAKKCTVAAARLVLEAAVKAGAPANIIAWLEEPTIELSNALMHHPDVQAILATGGPGMVKAAYSSGKPALGVGPGNTPAIIDETADIKLAVSSILLSKTFDNGMICASEQSIVAVADIYKEVKKELTLRGAYLLSRAEADKLGKIILSEKGTINAQIVGQPASKIAALAGLKVPSHAKVLVSEETSYAADNPFAYEKLSPILTLYKAKDYREAVAIAATLIELGGLGHTSVLYTDERTQERIDYFATKLPTCRLLINSPSSHGGIGDLYNFRLEPSLTLGCGSWGGNSVSGNVGVKHLLNLKTVAERKENMLWYRVPPKIYFKRGSTDLALREYEGKKRAFIITDRFLFNSGAVRSLTNVLEEIGTAYEIFFEVQPDPTLSTVKAALNIVRPYEPDLIIALGGGSPMDVAKIIWLMYEQPDTKFEDISMRFMDIRKRICAIPELGQKASLVCIPTTSGTGSEVTPFSIITDDKEHVKYAIADYALTPSMAIIDPDFVDSMPKSLTAAGGIDALVHAVEAYVSIMATNFTNAQALEAIKQIFRYLPRSYREGRNDPRAREKMHYAATIAGMSFANAFLGICHSMAHKIGAAFNIPHGIANALLICQVIRFNATDCPKKQAAFPQYKAPEAKKRYAQIAHNLYLGGQTEDEQVELLLQAIAQLKADLEIPSSIQEYFAKHNPAVQEADFLAKLDFLVRNAFDDQCTGANPVYPLLSDIRQIYLDAYYGKF
ncbi:bifunctional acetaldehyde-CoA/alcohol dehydrogenase [Candidatus Termititenax persephonae]|uniref:Aldehyde-alcohol dehydrogenase n=1 Tax=Candidatus Termititenax persephonae TaxID=2218525 RepID=A0A388TFK5_9BACT|nr:bifunctional acetaldehyde-CoA/alcohol dehydrogenase [Candidatus Termititenax persephonae]